VVTKFTQMKDIKFKKAGVKLKHTQRPQLGPLLGKRRCWKKLKRRKLNKYISADLHLYLQGFLKVPRKSYVTWMKLF
jgi:hypothetical protein